MAPLARGRLVLVQDPLDEAHVAGQLRPAHRHDARVSGRARVLQNLRHRPAVDPKPSSRLPPAHPVPQHRQPDAPAKLHAVHPPPPDHAPSRGLQMAGFYTARPGPSQAPTWPTITPPFSPGGRESSGPSADKRFRSPRGARKGPFPREPKSSPAGPRVEPAGRRSGPCPAALPRRREDRASEGRATAEPMGLGTAPHSMPEHPKPTFGLPDAPWRARQGAPPHPALGGGSGGCNPLPGPTGGAAGGGDRRAGALPPRLQ